MGTGNSVCNACIAPITPRLTAPAMRPACLWFRCECKLARCRLGLGPGEEVSDFLIEANTVGMVSTYEPVGAESE
jgi:hypothetical protein